jgi:hypothetical protein
MRALFLIFQSLWLLAQPSAKPAAPTSVDAILRRSGLKAEKRGQTYRILEAGYGMDLETTITGYRIRYLSACNPETSGLQVFLRESGIVKAYGTESGDTLLEANLPFAYGSADQNLSSFVLSFRAMVDAYRGSAEKRCTVKVKESDGPTGVSTASAVHGKFKIRLDQEEWRLGPGKTENIQQFTHRSGEAFLLVISERVSTPKQSLAEVALGNARNLDPQAKLTRQEVVQLSGREVLAIEMLAEAKGLRFRYLGRMYSGSSGTVQVVAFTLEQHFAEYQSKMQTILDSLTIEDEVLPGAYIPDATRGNRSTLSLAEGKAAIEFDRDRWRVSKDEGGRREWSEKDGKALAIVITEPVTMKSEDLAEIALTNLEKASTDYKVSKVGPGKVNGIDMTCVEAAATVNRLPFAYRGCFLGMDKASYQLVGMILAEHAAEALPYFENFLSGFRLVPVLK